MLRDDWKEYQKAVSRLIARAWLDEEFKRRLIADPATVLAENQLTVPSGVQVRVNENASVGSIVGLGEGVNSDAVYEIPLPAKPEDLTDEQIRSWSEGGDTEIRIAACI
ncbi:MAG TPA: hypothetical protein DD379_22165 [Cyanobacteria bacterium UBA11162]|nr:hypothetical protein [Cyanobacteria bacterium UBA11162]